jgi:hypothetical protein
MPNISELAKLVFSNLADFYSVDAKGRVVFDCQTALKIDPLSARNIDPLRVVS